MSKKTAEKIEKTCAEILIASAISKYNSSLVKAKEVLPYYCKKNKVKEETIKKIMEL